MANKNDYALLPKVVADRWGGELTHLSLGTEQVRFWWMGNGPRKSLDPWVESFAMDDIADASPVITGSITLRASGLNTPIPPISIGDRIIAEMRNDPTAGWQELGRLRVQEPQRLANSGQYTYQLANDAILLAAGTDSWWFPNQKSHYGGWYPWQIVEEVGRRSRVNIVMPRVGKRIRRFRPMLTSSPIDVINVAMKHVRDTERKLLVRRYINGTLYLNERHYSPELMTLGPQLIEASLTYTKREQWATDLTVRTTAEVWKGFGLNRQVANLYTHQGIKVNVSRAAFVQRYGYVHMIVYAHGVHSAAQARQLGLEHLIRVLQPKRTLTLTTPLIPRLRRGAYIRLSVASLGLTQIVHVESISYSLSPGSYTMDVTCGFDDPILAPPVDRVNLSTAHLRPRLKSPKTDKKTLTPLQSPVTFGGAPTR